MVWVRVIKYIDSHSEKFRNSEEHPMSFGRKKGEREKAESYSSEAKHCFATFRFNHWHLQAYLGKCLSLIIRINFS